MISNNPQEELHVGPMALRTADVAINDRLVFDLKKSLCVFVFGVFVSLWEDRRVAKLVDPVR